MDKYKEIDFEILIKISIGLILIVLNCVIANSQPLFSIFVTPMIIPFICLMMNYVLIKRSFQVFVTTGYAFLLINDLLIRLRAIEIGDTEGNSFIFLSFLITYLIISLGFWIYFFTKHLENKRKNMIILLISMVFVFIEYSMIQLKIGIKN